MTPQFTFSFSSYFLLLSLRLPSPLAHFAFSLAHFAISYNDHSCYLYALMFKRLSTAPGDGNLRLSPTYTTSSYYPATCSVSSAESCRAPGVAVIIIPGLIIFLFSLPLGIRTTHILSFMFPVAGCIQLTIQHIWPTVTPPHHVFAFMITVYSPPPSLPIKPYFHVSWCTYQLNPLRSSQQQVSRRVLYVMVIMIMSGNPL